MFNLGTLFSICAGILIGLKIYDRHREKAEKRAEKQRVYELFERINKRKRMQEIIDQQKYGVIYLEKDERIVPLRNGKYILIKDISPAERFWCDLWYGGVGCNGKDR